MGAARLDGPGPPARGAARPAAGVDLPRRSVGHRHRDGAAGGRRGAGRSRRSATPPASRTSSSCASSCAAWASASRARASHTIRVEGGSRLGGATKTLYGDYIEAGSWAVVAAITGGEIEIRGAREVDMEVVTSTLRKLSVHCEQRRRRPICVEPSQLHRRRADHHRPVARLPERPGQPGDRAGDAGRRRDAGARLDVRAAAVRARADERHGRRSLPVRSPPHHRHRTGAGCAASRSTAATSARAWR